MKLKDTTIKYKPIPLTVRKNKYIIKESDRKEKLMKIWKIISGCLSILISIQVGFISVLILRVGFSLEDSRGFLEYSTNFKYGGFAGLIVAIVLFLAGIFSIKDRNKGKEADLMLMILFGIASGMALIGGTTEYSDLLLCAAWCVLNLVLAFVSFMKS